MHRIALPIALALLTLAAPARGGESFDPDSLPSWQRYAWQDLGLILNRAEEAELLGLPDGEAVVEWTRRYWLRKDPTPTTEANERREEHFKRLETARALYPARGATGLDQRGEDYLLFGPPDETSEIDEWFDDTGHHPARLIWIWFDPEMRATYSDWNLDGEWQQAWDELPSSRPDVRQRVDSAFGQDGQAEDTRLLEELRSRDPLGYQDLVRQLAEGELVNALEVQSQMVIADLMGSKFRRMEAEYHKNRGERREVYNHDFQAQPLWAVFAVDCYRGEAGRSRVELSHQMRARDLRFDWDFERRHFKAEVLRRVVFYDERDQVAATSEERLPIFAESVEDTRSALLLPGLSVHQLRPGGYRMALRLEDTVGGALQIFTTRVEVPPFPGDSLALSDISFASTLGQGRQPELFRKGEWVVTPHPMRMYSTTGTVQLYFEAYGLATDAEGLNDYTVTYRIRSRDPVVKSSWLWTREDLIDAEVGSTFADRHGGEMARHPLSLSAAGFAEDSYVLEVELTDRIAGRSIRRRGQFSVVPESSSR